MQAFACELSRHTRLDVTSDVLLGTAVAKEPCSKVKPWRRVAGKLLDLCSGVDGPNVSFCNIY